MTVPSHRRLRAPTADGAALIDPPLSQALSLIEFNRATGAEFDRSAGFPADYRLYARLIAAALAGVEKPHELFGAPAIVSGHQPELFHPGVWLKNYIASAIAESVGGTALNLVIDSDTIRSASIRVPTGSPTAPRVEDIPFDAPGENVPWQLREVLDEDLFRSFAARVRSAFNPYATTPVYRRGMILDELWPAAVESKALAIQQLEERLTKLDPSSKPLTIPPEVCLAKQKLASALTFARHQAEREAGLLTQDLPLQFLSITVQFMQFADHLLARHQEFHAIYNAALAEYRAANHIRNGSHPVPDLARDGEWYETPFWLWTDENPHRRRAFVRQAGTTWELTDRLGTFFRPPSGSEHDANETLSALIRMGPTFRPRALITTMYARLVLSDLFIHGIGGAKYDEVTDGIIRRFFGIEPPKYITATATFRLPIDRPQVTIEDVRDVQRKLRDVRYRPEAFLRDPLTGGEAGLRERLQALADEKREYVRTHDLRRCEAHVFQRLDTINRAMHDLLRPVEQELHAQHSLLIEQLHRARLLGSREFSFCLFPAEELPARLLALSKVSA